MNHKLWHTLPEQSRQLLQVSRDGLIVCDIVGEGQAWGRERLESREMLHGELCPASPAGGVRFDRPWLCRSAEGEQGRQAGSLSKGASGALAISCGWCRECRRATMSMCCFLEE